MVNGKRGSGEGRAWNFRHHPPPLAAERYQSQLTLPFSFRTVPIDDRNPDTVAVMRGPVMLSASIRPRNWQPSAKALAAMEPVPGKPLEFDCRTASGKVRLAAVLPRSQPDLQHLFPPEAEA